MIGVGEGIAIASVCGVVVTGIMKVVPSRQPTNGSSPVTKDLCKVQHKGLDQMLGGMNERLGSIEDDMKLLLRHQGIPES